MSRNKAIASRTVTEVSRTNLTLENETAIQFNNDYGEAVMVASPSRLKRAALNYAVNDEV